MEKPIFNRSLSSSKRPEGRIAATNAEILDEHVQRFIEELTRGLTPQEAARHAENFRNSKMSYLLEKIRHQNFWSMTS